MATQNLTNFVFDHETMSVLPVEAPLLGYPNPGFAEITNLEINDITVERKMELKELAHRDTTPDDVLNDILDQPLVTTGIIFSFIFLNQQELLAPKLARYFNSKKLDSIIPYRTYK